MTDADTSQRCYASAGDGVAFAAFVRESAPPLHRFLARLLGNGDPVLIEELAQRTFIVTARRAKSYRGPSAIAWVLGIAFREVRSHRREICRLRAREVAMPEEELANFEAAIDRHGGGPAEAAEARERLDLLRQALARLELRERLALELVYLEGLTHAVAAEALSCLALLAPGRVTDLGPSVPTDLAERTSRWTQAALAGSAAVDVGSGAVSRGFPAVSIARGFASRLAIAAGIVALVAVPAAIQLWQGRERPQGVVASGDGAALVPVPPATPLDPVLPPPAPPVSRRAAAGTEEEAATTSVVVAKYVWARGTVREADGSPLANVDLKVTEALDNLRLFPGDPVQSPVWLAGHSGPSRSASDGRFEVPFLETGLTGIRVNDYDGIARREHLLHLVATDPDGRVRTVRLRTRPVEPPEVEISFVEPGEVRGRILRAAGLPPLDGAGVAAVYRDVRPGRYDHFVRGNLDGEGRFVLADLEPGPWRLHPVHLPPASVIRAPLDLAVEVGAGKHVEVEIVLAVTGGLSGTIASPRGFGDVLDLAGSPSPFRFARAESGKRYAVVGSGPGGTAAERFGPFYAPAADLELRSATIEPQGTATLHLRGIDQAVARDGVAVIFAGTTVLARGYLQDGSIPDRPPQSLVLAGLAAGRYRVEVTVRESWRSRTMAQGTVSFEIGEREEKEIEVEIGGSRGLELIEAPALHALCEEPELNTIPQRRYTAFRLDGPAEHPASPIAGYGEEGSGTIRLGLPPGAWALHLPVDEVTEVREGYRCGSVIRVDVVAGERSQQVDLPPPSRAVLAVVLTDAALAARTLAISGRTADGLPVAIAGVSPASGRFEVTGLPPGTYRLTLLSRAGSPPLEKELVFDGVRGQVPFP